MLRVCSALEEDLSLIPSTYNSLLTPPGDLIAPTLGGTCTHLYPHAYTHMRVRTHVHAHTLKFNKNLGIMFSFIYIFSPWKESWSVNVSQLERMWEIFTPTAGLRRTTKCLNCCYCPERGSQALGPTAVRTGC